MRILFKISALLTIIATLFIAVTAVVLWANQVSEVPLKLNWPFLIPGLIISGLTIIFGCSGVITIATNPHVWKTLKELHDEQQLLRNERAETRELKQKLIDKITSS